MITRAYELMIIIDSDVVDIEIPKVISRTEALITEEGGRIASTDNWGRRKFAYEINHKSEGTYVVWEIVTESAGLPNTERQLRLGYDLPVFPDLSRHIRQVFFEIFPGCVVVGIEGVDGFPPIRNSLAQFGQVALEMLNEPHGFSFTAWIVHGIANRGTQVLECLLLDVRRRDLVLARAGGKNQRENDADEQYPARTDSLDHTQPPFGFCYERRSQ